MAQRDGQMVGYQFIAECVSQISGNLNFSINRLQQLHVGLLLVNSTFNIDHKSSVC